MRLQQIRYFLVLAEELHFWRSAEKLFTSQSTLSRQIQYLEEELGIQLFERDKRNVKLTPAGEFLKNNWSKLIEDFDLSKKQARKINEGSSGNISLAYPGSIAFRFLPELLKRIHQNMPDLKVELTEPTDESHIRLLMDFSIDISFSRDGISHPHIQSKKLNTESISLVVPENHRITKESFKDLRDAKDENFIISSLHHSTFFATLLRNLFAQFEFEPKTIVESDFGNMILALISKGLGISILPSSFKSAGTQGLRFIELEETVDLYINRRKNDPNFIVYKITELAEEVADEI